MCAYDKIFKIHCKRQDTACQHLMDIARSPQICADGSAHLKTT